MDKQDTINAECSMKMDYSQVNLQYLIQTRDLIRQDPQLGPALLGIPHEMAHLLSNLSPQQLTQIIQIKSPLLSPHQEAWWWSHLLTAMRDGRLDEIDAVIAHVPLFLLR